MKCHDCGRDTAEESTQDHPYTESGLDNVVLCGIQVRKCSACGASEAVIRSISPLHRAIAKELLHVPRFLRGPEVCFLRKILDWPRERLAQFLGLHPCFMIIWEDHGLHRDLTTLIPADRLLRVMLAYKLATSLDIFSLLPQIQGDDGERDMFQAMLLPNGVWAVRRTQ